MIRSTLRGKYEKWIGEIQLFKSNRLLRGAQEYVLWTKSKRTILEDHLMIVKYTLEKLLSKLNGHLNEDNNELTATPFEVNVRMNRCRIVSVTKHRLYIIDNAMKCYNNQNDNGLHQSMYEERIDGIINETIMQIIAWKQREERLNSIISGLQRECTQLLEFITLSARVSLNFVPNRITLIADIHVTLRHSGLVRNERVDCCTVKKCFSGSDLYLYLTTILPQNTLYPLLVVNMLIEHQILIPLENENNESIRPKSIQFQTQFLRLRDDRPIVCITKSGFLSKSRNGSWIDAQWNVEFRLFKLGNRYFKIDTAAAAGANDDYDHVNMKKDESNERFALDILIMNEALVDRKCMRLWSQSRDQRDSWVRSLQLSACSCERRDIHLQNHREFVWRLRDKLNTLQQKRIALWRDWALFCGKQVERSLWTLVQREDDRDIVEIWIRDTVVWIRMRFQSLYSYFDDDSILLSFGDAISYQIQSFLITDIQSLRMCLRTLLRHDHDAIVESVLFRAGIWKIAIQLYIDANNRNNFNQQYEHARVLKRDFINSLAQSMATIRKRVDTIISVDIYNVLCQLDESPEIKLEKYMEFIHSHTNDEAINADELLILLAVWIVNQNAPQLAAHVQMIRSFFPQSHRGLMIEYYFTSLEAALEYIVTIPKNDDSHDVYNPNDGIVSRELVSHQRDDATRNFCINIIVIPYFDGLATAIFIVPT